MTISKRYFRNFKHNTAFYISSAILTAVSILLFLTVFTAGTSLQNEINSFMNESKVEDGEFTTYISISDNDITEMEERFDLVIERNRFFNYEKNGITIRLFKGTNNINQYKVVEGHDIENSEDILLSREFCENNDIKIGDKYSIKDKQYNVVGFTVRPDYLYMLKELSDSYRNNKTFGIGIISPEKLDALGEISEYFSVIYNDKSEINEFRQYLFDNFKTLIYVASENNQRINYAKTSPYSYILMACAILPIMLVLVMAMISIVLGRTIKQEKKILGTLYALGYRKGQLKRFYVGYAFIPGFIGSVIGIILSRIFVNSIAGFLSKDFENIFGTFHIPAMAMIVCIVLPCILYMVAAYVVTNKLLKIGPVLLLKGIENEKERKSRFLVRNHKVSFGKKFQFRLLLNNKMRTVVVLFSIIMCCFIMEIGFICNNSTSKFVDSSIDKIGNFEYEYFLNTIHEAKAEDQGNTLIYGSFQPQGIESQFTLLGYNDDNKYIDLKNLEGQPINLDDGYYMTNNAAILFNVKAGDDFTFYNPASMKKCTVTIKDIVDDDTQKMIYTSRKNAGEILEIKDGYYNLVMSDKKLNIDDSEISITNSKDALKKQLNSILDSTQKMIVMMIIIGIIICIFTIYLTVNMIIDENKVNISMLKVLGYKNMEINKLVLNVNHIVVPFGILFSIPLSVAICEMYFKMMIDNFACYIKAVIDIKSVVICAFIVVISYIVSLNILKRKVYKIDMVESLKDNR